MEERLLSETLDRIEQSTEALRDIVGEGPIEFLVDKVEQMSNTIDSMKINATVEFVYADEGYVECRVPQGELPRLSYYDGNWFLELPLEITKLEEHLNGVELKTYTVLSWGQDATGYPSLHTSPVIFKNAQVGAKVNFATHIHEVTIDRIGDISRFEVYVGLTDPTGTIPNPGPVTVEVIPENRDLTTAYSFYIPDRNRMDKGAEFEGINRTKFDSILYFYDPQIYDKRYAFGLESHWYERNMTEKMTGTAFFQGEINNIYMTQDFLVPCTVSQDIEDGLIQLHGKVMYVENLKRNLYITYKDDETYVAYVNLHSESNARYDASAYLIYEDHEEKMDEVIIDSYTTETIEFDIPVAEFDDIVGIRIDTELDNE